MSTRKSVAWALSGQVATFLVSLIGSILLARLLSPREMGIYAVAVATAGIVQIIAAAGISTFVIREPTLTRERLDTAFTVNAIVNITIAALMFGASWQTARFMAEPAVGPVLRFLAMTPLIGILDFRPAAMLQREMRLRPAAIIGTTGTLLVSGTQVVLAWYGFSYMSMAYASLAGAIFTAGANSLVAPAHVSLRISLADWRAVAGFGLRMLTISGVATLAQRGSELILGRLLGVVALGLYSRASNIGNLVFFNIYGTATRITFTKLSKDYRETGNITDTFLIGLELIIGIMWPMLFGLAILAGPVIEIMYGAKWLGAAPVLSLLMLAQVVVLCFGMNWELFVLRDEINRQTRYEAIRALFGTGVFAIGCLFTISAAATGRIVEALFGVALYLPHMSRLSGAAPSRIARIYLRGAALSGAAVWPSLVLMIASDWSPMVDRAVLAGAIALGGLSWLVALHLFDNALVRELHRLRAALLPRLFGRRPGAA